MQYLQLRLVILCISATSFFSLQAQNIPQDYDSRICMKLPKFCSSQRRIMAVSWWFAKGLT